ncbi:MAG: SDR family oxidoreductase [Rhizomicrobium sp.]|jgi:NAD(P)-dependent dehydrogenase (short-subunit alcohol dehydrogenase family)
MTGNGKVVVITGAGTGIGRATAVAFARRNARLVLCGRRRPPLEEAARECEAAGGTVLVIETDVSDPVAVKALFEATKKRFDRLDVLFNNAGIGARRSALEDVPFKDWSSVVATNLTGAFLCTQEAIKMMKSQDPRGGRIINNGSVSAFVPRPYSSPYTITKHAMTGLTKATALEGRKYDIACGQVDVGNALTDLSAQIAAGVVQANGSVAAEPMMDVQHVADAVVSMAELPLDTNILSMTLMATNMPYVGRG